MRVTRGYSQRLTGRNQLRQFCPKKIDLPAFTPRIKNADKEFQSKNVNPELGPDTCAICTTECEDLEREEYALAAACHQLDLLHAIMICGKCSEKMQDLVSKHTKGVWDKFFEENFPGVPADALPQPGGVPVIA